MGEFVTDRRLFSPPNGVLTMVGTLATKTHRTLHHLDTDETMVSGFYSAN